MIIIYGTIPTSFALTSLQRTRTNESSCWLWWVGFLSASRRQWCVPITACQAMLLLETMEDFCSTFLVSSLPVLWRHIWSNETDHVNQRNPNPLHLMTLYTSPRRPDVLKRVELPQSTGLQVTHFRHRRCPFHGKYIERNHDEIHDRQVSTVTQQSIEGSRNEITSLQQFARHPRKCESWCCIYCVRSRRNPFWAWSIPLQKLL